MNKLTVKKSIDYAKGACNTLMKTPACDLPPKGRFHYHQGVFLSGMNAVYHITKEPCYEKYIKDWVDSLVDADGNIIYWENTELDDIMPANLLFDLYDKTKDERYKKVLNQCADLLKSWPCNEFGGFWHKEMYKNQMWLDGIYMAGPFMARYAKVFGKTEFLDILEKQTKLMNEHLRDEKDGLFFHGWDATKTAKWANRVTGRSPEKWGRAMGWYTVAMLDILEQLSEDDERRSFYTENERLIMDSLLKYCDKEKHMWYQIVDKGGMNGNYIELSCSCLYLYSICKGISMGVFDESYQSVAEKIYHAIISLIETDENGNVYIGHVCIGTGIDDYEYYVNVPTSVNDLHGVGAFVLMCCEYYKLFKK